MYPEPTCNIVASCLTHSGCPVLSCLVLPCPAWQCTVIRLWVCVEWGRRPCCQQRVCLQRRPVCSQQHSSVEAGSVCLCTSVCVCSWLAAVEQTLSCKLFHEACQPSVWPPTCPQNMVSDGLTMGQTVGSTIRNSVFQDNRFVWSA